MNGDKSAGSDLIRILTVDDHPLLREGIAGLVADQLDMSLVAEASNGLEAIQQFREHRPDITLMDLQRRASATRPQSRSPRLPAKEYVA